MYKTQEYKERYLPDFIKLLRNTEFESHDAWVNALQDFIGDMQETARQEGILSATDSDTAALIDKIRKETMATIEGYRAAYAELTTKHSKLYADWTDARNKLRSHASLFITMFSRGVRQGAVQALHILDNTPIEWPEGLDKNTNSIIENVVDKAKGVIRNHLSNMPDVLICNSKQHSDVFDKFTDTDKFRPTPVSPYKFDDTVEIVIDPAPPANNIQWRVMPNNAAEALNAAANALGIANGANGRVNQEE